MTIRFTKLFFAILPGLVCCVGHMASAQQTQNGFTHQDTLRGSLGPGRQGWDVLHYDIAVQPDYNSKSISGKNIVRFYDSGVKKMQIDLQQPMVIDSVIHHNKPLTFRREGNVAWVMLRDTAAMYKIRPGVDSLSIYFHGKPREALKAPWDGGWLWKKDKSGNPWMTVACQGLGASVWYPCKDYQGDEPDSGATLRITVPDTLVAVGNGRLQTSRKTGSGLQEYIWDVKSPINNYNIVPYIGKYVHFGETYPGVNGPLSMDYWVIKGYEDTAKKQFADAPRMMKAFEYWFGPYPFYADGYKLVQTPHLGMEHQSAVAYGNGFQNGYAGRDLSGTGWGMKFDFIIVHESGHEWFANNITTKDIADMWVHEGFTNYSETLFTDYYYGKQAGNDYVIGTRKNIANDIPIIGKYGVNSQGSGDMYYKAGNMIHIIRQLVNDDEKFRKMLHALNEKFYHQTVSSALIEKFINDFTKQNFSKIFDQYLRTTQVPVLEYACTGGTFKFRWTNCVAGFNMPLQIQFGDSTASTRLKIYPQTTWKTLKPGKTVLEKPLIIDRNFYVRSEKIE